MNIDIQSDPEHEEPRRKVNPPTDFTSRAIRIRLFLLFGMLALVLVLMNEARKPERWEWMGFGKVNPQAQGEQDKPAQDFEPPINNESAANQEQQTQQAFEAALNNSAQSAEYPVEAVRFWQSTFVNFKTERQKALFQLMRFVRSGEKPENLEPTQMESFNTLLKSLKIKRQNFHTELFNKISFLADDAPEKKNLNEQLFESKALWTEKILPAFEDSLAGEGTTVSQLAAVERLQVVLDQLAFAQVADGETLKRPGEGMAWLRMWETLLQDKKTDYQPVTHIELSSQPAAYRGKSIQVMGWVRSARKFAVPRNELGLDHYYVLWMRPVDTNVAPFCVYSQDLPAGFPHVTSRTLELNEPATVNGQFFKIHSYRNASNEVANCPLILAKSFDWNPIVLDPVEKFDSWQPPRWMVIAGFIVIPIMATGIAWFAYRNTQMKRFEPGQKTQQNIKKKLGGLSTDPNVQTELEKVSALYEMDEAE